MSNGRWAAECRWTDLNPSEFCHKPHPKPHTQLLFLPYRDSSVAKRIFDNCERARTHYSVQNKVRASFFFPCSEYPNHHPQRLSLLSSKVPGLYACTNDVAKPNETTVPDYISFTGVPTIASELSTTWRYDVLTPYAAFPVVLANKSVGMVWYLNTLQGPR